MTSRLASMILAGSIRRALETGATVRIRGEWYGVVLSWGRQTVKLPDSFWGLQAEELYELILA